MASKLLPKKKLILLHFLPLEKYPPVMNFINAAAQTCQFEIVVCTTSAKGSNWFTNPGCKIYRFGPGLESRWTRGLTYFLYNFLSFCILLIKNPGIIFYYETLSSFPVNIYSLFRYDFRLFVHYHEYVSELEKKQGSAYYRFLLYNEQRLLHKANWISQTNQDRCKLFLNDYPFVNLQHLHAMPNYPPLSWGAKLTVKSSGTKCPCRIVYVGSVGAETMYLKEFANWVVARGGDVIWDIYSDKYSTDVLSFFRKLHSPFIQLKSGITYFELPAILSSYHVGVVLYKGHIPNFIYNVPNKVVEYLFCGLEVWCPKQMKSVRDFKVQYPEARIVLMDFDHAIEIKDTLLSDSEYMPQPFNHCTAEQSFQPLFQAMSQIV